MERKDLPPPYPGPVLSYSEFHAVEQTQMAAFPPQPVLQAAPMFIDPVVQQPVSIVQQAPPTTIIQPAPQPTVTVIQQAPPPAIIQPAVQPAVAVVSPVVIQPRLREIPGQLKCTYCQRDIVTVTRFINGALVWTIFGGLCITGIWPFCLIPFCVNACKDVEHSCPHCHNIISIYRRM
ncbi:lipopolysaccharide-induced tumor necrosis factor-alpha factor homolog [Colossoma macropomum]|uniref:lipopolysaccharide-induced tumor necrosis factor-alpha factor homolog n=1 Tax=Colossoma macropomum TaxID=42526 RepID=UPI001863C33A|nr:lipopolysaccharide-induced tumor necrosis factor-alpha factor homolog [Colossoma macropomum]